MKVAVITITYNDGYKFKEWCEHYEEYKNETFLHIIVDNGSEPEYLRQVKDYFTESVIIERNSNGGCTLSYNEGIRVALANKEVEYIVLIGNDIKLPSGNLTLLANSFKLDNKLGMVEPVLFEADSSIINDFGCSIDNHLFMNSYLAGKDFSEIKDDIHYCDAVTGGMNMASREFYETVGLQDELLFMYSDEVDMGIRAKKYGFKLAAISCAKSWHQHINPDKKTNRRHPFSRYLIARNKTYLMRKHYGNLKCFCEFVFFIKQSTKNIIRNTINGNLSSNKDENWQIIGALNGLLGNMAPNKYSHI